METVLLHKSSLLCITPVSRLSSFGFANALLTGVTKTFVPFYSAFPEIFLISCISASNRMPRNAFQPPDGSGRHKKIYPASGIYSADGPIDTTSGRMVRVSVFYRRHVPSVRRGKQPVQRGRRTAGTRAAVRWRAGNPAYGTKVRKRPAN